MKSKQKSPKRHFILILPSAAVVEGSHFLRGTKIFNHICNGNQVICEYKSPNLFVIVSEFVLGSPACANIDPK